MRTLLPLVLLAFAGCGYLGTAREVDPDTLKDIKIIRAIEPLRQSTENDCGPTALAMVLRYWGDPVTQAEALAALPPREGGGVTAAALRDYAKQRKFEAYVFPGEEKDLEEQLGKGRPLIVGLVKPYIDKFRCHFEVVAGYDAATKRVVTVDPGRGWTVNTIEGFLAEWGAAKRPTLLIARQEGPPK